MSETQPMHPLERALPIVYALNNDHVDLFAGPEIESLDQDESVTRDHLVIMVSELAQLWVTALRDDFSREVESDRDEITRLVRDHVDRMVAMRIEFIRPYIDPPAE